MYFEYKAFGTFCVFGYRLRNFHVSCFGDVNSIGNLMLEEKPLCTHGLDDTEGGYFEN